MEIPGAFFSSGFQSKPVFDMPPFINQNNYYFFSPSKIISLEKKTKRKKNAYYTRDMVRGRGEKEGK